MTLALDCEFVVGDLMAEFEYWSRRNFQRRKDCLYA